MPLPTRVRTGRRLLRDEAFGVLKDLIVEGELQPGEPLRDQAIAEWLGVSRMPVREALGRLADDRLVVIAANRFTRVAPLTAAQASDAHRVVALLEGECAARRAAAGGGAAQLAPLADTFRWALWRGERAEAIVADEMFHRALRTGSAAISDEIVAVLERIEPHARRAQRATWDAIAGGWPDASHDHLLDALVRGDREAARAAASGEWEALATAVAQALAPA
jgi:DNA-binding GntR family transcriptional regulator